MENSRNDRLQERRCPVRGAPRRTAGPRPGHEKTVSTVMAPETTNPRLMNTSVIVGSIAFGTACAPAHQLVHEPLGPGDREVVLAHLVDQRGTHHQRVLGEVDRGQRRRGQHQVPRPSRMPSSDRVDAGGDDPADREDPRGDGRADPEQISRIMPSQNSGIAYRVRVTADGDAVEALPALPAARMPIRIPMIEASRMAVPTSSSVGSDPVSDHVPHRPVEPGGVDRRTRTGWRRRCTNCSTDRLVELGAQLGDLLGRDVAPAGVQRRSGHRAASGTGRS